jgi:hypothetical protein
MDTTEAATRKLVIKLAAKYRRGWAHGIRAPWVDREATTALWRHPRSCRRNLAIG